MKFNSLLKSKELEIETGREKGTKTQTAKLMRDGNSTNGEKYI